MKPLQLEEGRKNLCGLFNGTQKMTCCIFPLSFCFRIKRILPKSDVLSELAKSKLAVFYSAMC